MNSRDERSVADLGLYINCIHGNKYYNIHLFFDGKYFIRLVVLENQTGIQYYDYNPWIAGKKWNF